MTTPLLTEEQADEFCAKLLGHSLQLYKLFNRPLEAVSKEELREIANAAAELGAQATIERLAQASGVMPVALRNASWVDAGSRYCKQKEVEQAIATLQAQKEANRKEIHALRNVVQAACFGQAAFAAAWKKYFPDSGELTVSEPKLEAVEKDAWRAYKASIILANGSGMRKGLDSMSAEDRITGALECMRGEYDAAMKGNQP